MYVMLNFPIFNAKKLSDGKTYDLNDPAERRQYFTIKLGDKIEELKEFLDSNTFVGFLVAKKSAGKGTYSKLFQEIIGSERVALLSVGDVVRRVHGEITKDSSKKKELEDFMAKNYRGLLSLEDSMEAFVGRSQDKLIPTEFILTLVKREIQNIGRKAIFIDGFPRDFDQISYSLYFRDLVNFREDPDFFVLIDVPESVIDARMRGRVVCPICKTSRHLTLLPTKFVQYDKDSEEFYLVCDNNECTGFNKERLVGKEGDSAGIESIRGRLDKDAKLMELALQLHGVPRVLLRNSVPSKDASKYYDSYELTPEYSYKVGTDGSVEVMESSWEVDANGESSHSLLAAPVVLSMIDQIHSILLG